MKQYFKHFWYLKHHFEINMMTISINTIITNLCNVIRTWKSFNKVHLNSHSLSLTYPIVWMTIGASRMIGQPLLSIPLCPQPFEGLHPTLILSILIYYLPISFSVSTDSSQLSISSPGGYVCFPTGNHIEDSWLLHGSTSYCGSSGECFNSSVSLQFQH